MARMSFRGLYIAGLGMAITVSGWAMQGSPKVFEAVIRQDSKHVVVYAEDFNDAREKIQGMYCGGSSCIVEGPWERH